MKAKFFVAYLLKGEAKAYHQRLTQELASRYHIFDLHTRVSPHITIKPPFEADEEQVAEIERVLRAFSHHEHAPRFFLRGFGRFGFRTAYLNVHKSPEAIALVRRLIATLNQNLSWLPRYPLEGNKLHSSVARFMTRKQSRRVIRFLKDEQPHFDLTFDNVAILKKTERTWSVISVIHLKGDEPAWPLLTQPQEAYSASR